MTLMFSSALLQHTGERCQRVIGRAVAGACTKSKSTPLSAARQLPSGFHRIRHYGLFANANRADNIATARAFLDVAPPAADPQQQSDITPDAPRVLPCPCPRCGDRMIMIEVFASGCEPRWRPTPNRIDTS